MSDERPTDDFPPIVYALLAALVAAGFAVAGAIEWWQAALAAAWVFGWERFGEWRRGRR